jgi:hypothetical protein
VLNPGKSSTLDSTVVHGTHRPRIGDAKCDGSHAKGELADQRDPLSVTMPLVTTLMPSPVDGLNPDAKTLREARPLVNNVAARPRPSGAAGSLLIVACHSVGDAGSQNPLIEKYPFTIPLPIFCCTVPLP